MMKLLSIVMLVFTLSPCCGQYLPNSSQPFQFASLYNPAFAGTDEFSDLKLSYRYQFAGFGPVAPQYINLAFNTRLKSPVDLKTNALRTSQGNQINDKRYVPGSKRIIHGLGANLFSTKENLIKRFGGGVTYSFHYPISKTTRIAIGSSALFENLKLNVDAINFGPGTEPTSDELIRRYLAGGPNQSEVTVRVGMLIYGKSFYVGGGYIPVSYQVESSAISFSDIFYTGSLQAGVSIPVSAQFTLKPSVFGLLQNDNKVLMDYSVKGYLKEKGWVGVTYRDVDTATLSLGFDFNAMLGACYSYEWPLNSLKEFNSNSHEVVLVLRLNNIRNQNQYAW